MSGAVPISRASASALEATIAALPEAALVYSADRKIIAANDLGREALVELRTSADDPWGLADMSLDLLLHRVLSREPATASVDLHDHGGALIAEARAARITFARHTRAVLLTIRSKTNAGDLDSARSGLVARLLPGLAHEVRSPLTTISGLTQMLGSLAALPLDIRSHVASVPGMVDRSDQLLRNAVSLVRPDGREVHLPSSLNEAVASAQGMLAYELRARGIQLSTELDPTLPLCDASPETLLHLVLVLLLSQVDSSAKPRSIKISTFARPGRRIGVALEASPFQPWGQRIDEARGLLARLGGTLEPSAPSPTHGRSVGEFPGVSSELLLHPQRRALLLATDDLDRLLSWEQELGTAARPALLASSAAVAKRLMTRPDLAGGVFNLAIARRLSGRFPIPTLLVASPGEEREVAALAGDQFAWSPTEDVGKALSMLLR